MVQAPLLAKPVLNETLYLYLAVSEKALNAVLVKEEAKVQKSIYRVSKILHRADLNYSTIKNPKASGRLIKWVIELGEFDIKYKPRIRIKAQTLVDFVVECIIDNQEVGGMKVYPKRIRMKTRRLRTRNSGCSIYLDGALKTNSSGARLVQQSPDGFMIEYAMKLDFPGTNDEAEYEALIAGLDFRVEVETSFEQRRREQALVDPPTPKILDQVEYPPGFEPQLLAVYHYPQVVEPPPQPAFSPVPLAVYAPVPEIFQMPRMEYMGEQEVD
ncbi:uncharacterized protein LOC141673930 [Apium graveolens]|uniref:uncharacterized protein LOC141673930 n=1 Tax=Apium graveolens TaxID=4045 RepID=UPI003D7BE27A